MKNRKDIQSNLNKLGDFCKRTKESMNKNKFYQCSSLRARVQLCAYMNETLTTYFPLTKPLLQSMLEIRDPILSWTLLKKRNVDLNDGDIIQQIDESLFRRFVEKALQDNKIMYINVYHCVKISAQDKILCVKTDVNIFVVLFETVRDTPAIRDICNIPFVWKWENERNQENELINVHVNRLLKGGKETPHLEGKIAASLFRQHRNLNMITYSPVISVGFGARNHRIIPKPCIVLYCDRKGMLPFGEKMFPRNIDGVQTDVREGHYKFASGIQIGSEITREQNGTHYGTVGGFVDLPNGSKAVLTCAHVLYNLHDLGLDYSLQSGLTVSLANGRPSFGRVIEARFETDDQDRTSIDAALVQLNPDVDISGHFPNIHRTQLSDAGENLYII